MTMGNFPFVPGVFAALSWIALYFVVRSENRLKAKIEVAIPQRSENPFRMDFIQDDDGLWFVECPELDYAACGETEQECFSNFLTGLKATFEINNELKNLSYEEIVKMFEQPQRKPGA